MHRLCGHDVPECAIVVSDGGRGDLQVRTKPTMRNRMLRSVLVAAFSTVVALGALAGLSGVKGDVQRVGADTAHTVVAGDDDAQAFPADTVWD